MTGVYLYMPFVSKLHPGLMLRNETKLIKPSHQSNPCAGAVVGATVVGVGPGAVVTVVAGATVG
jgi:hypothetical protein